MKIKAKEVNTLVFGISCVDRRVEKLWTKYPNASPVPIPWMGPPEPMRACEREEMTLAVGDGQAKVLTWLQHH